MKITPLSFRNYSLLKFMANNSCSNPIEDKFKSKQNNSPDFFIDRNFYYNLVGKKHTAMAQKAGLLEFDDKNGLTPSADLTEDFNSDKNLELEQNASSKIKQIKLDAYLLGLAPEELEKDVPHFASIAPEGYINDLLSEAEAYEEKGDFLSNPNVIISCKVEADGQKDTKMLDNDFIINRFNKKATSLRQLAQYFRKNPSKLQESLDLMARAYDYKIYQVL